MANVFATETYVKGRNKTGDYTGTGVAFDISTGFEPRAMQIIDDATGEMIVKNKNQASSKCFLNKKFGNDQVCKTYILTNNGITFGIDKVTIGTSQYINSDGESYSYVIWG